MIHFDPSSASEASRWAIRASPVRFSAPTGDGFYQPLVKGIAMDSLWFMIGFIVVYYIKVFFRAEEGKFNKGLWRCCYLKVIVSKGVLNPPDAWVIIQGTKSKDVLPLPTWTKYRHVWKCMGEIKCLVSKNTEKDIAVKYPPNVFPVPWASISSFTSPKPLVAATQ